MPTTGAAGKKPGEILSRAAQATERDGSAERVQAR